MWRPILWHPGLRWHIDCIHVLLPIRFASIRRNEVKSVAMATKARTVMQGGEAELAIYTPADIQQRAALVLQEVRYVIEAHFSMTKNAAPGDNPGKFQDIMRRRLARGQCFHTPYLGCREFPACFREWRGGDIPAIGDSRELGYMLYDLDYSDPCEIKPLFFPRKAAARRAGRPELRGGLMILQALTRYYEVLLAQGRVLRPAGAGPRFPSGWSLPRTAPCWM